MPTAAEFQSLMGSSSSSMVEPAPSIASAPTTNFEINWADDEEAKRKKRREEFEALMTSKGVSTSRGPGGEVVAEPNDPKLTALERNAPRILSTAKAAAPTVAAGLTALGVAGAGPTAGLSSVLLPIAAAISAGGVTAGAQEKFLENAYGDGGQNAADTRTALSEYASEHPVDAGLSEALPGVLTGRPTAALNLAGRAVGAGIGAGIDALMTKAHGGDLSLTRSLTAAGAGALLDGSYGGRAQPVVPPMNKRGGVVSLPDASVFNDGPTGAAIQIPPRSGPSADLTAMAQAAVERRDPSIPDQRTGVPANPAPRSGPSAELTAMAKAAVEHKSEPLIPEPPPPETLESQYRPEQAKAIAATEAQIDMLREAAKGGTKKDMANVNMAIEGLRKRLAAEKDPAWKSEAERKAEWIASQKATVKPQAAPVAGKAPEAVPAENAPPVQPEAIPPPPEPGPDVTRLLNRGAHDALPVVFPDPVHAQLYDWAESAHANARGRGPAPSQDAITALSEAFGMDEATTRALAMDYYQHIDLMKNTSEFPSHFDEPGVRITAPALMEPRIPAAELPLMTRAEAEDAGVGPIHEAAVHKAFADGHDMNPENLRDYPDLEQAMEAIGPEPPPPETPPTPPPPDAPPGTPPTPGRKAPKDWAGNINLGRVNGPADVRAMAKEVAARHDSFSGQRRGVQSNADTLAAANRMADNLGIDLADIKPGTAMNARMLASVEVIWQKASAELIRTANLVRHSPTAENMARFAEAEARQALTQEVYSGGIAEAGRALQILKAGAASRTWAQRVAAILKAEGCD